MSSQTETPPIRAQVKKDASKPAMGDGIDHGGMKMDLTAATRVTDAQRWGMAFISLVALGAGVIYSASFTNLNLGASDVGGAIMPPGMIMLRDTPAAAMRDMSAIDPRKVSYTAPVNAQGDQTLQPRVENDIKVFDLTTSVIKWNILPNKQVMAYTFNQQVPGPRIRIAEGDRVRINVTNNLPEIYDGALARLGCAKQHGWSRLCDAAAD